jgi:hypothetical protein
MKKKVKPGFYFLDHNDGYIYIRYPDGTWERSLTLLPDQFAPTIFNWDAEVLSGHLEFLGDL